MENLTHIQFRFGLLNKLNTLAIAAYDAQTGKSVYTAQMSIPPQDYRYWTEVVDGKEVMRRDYVSGGFHNGRFCRSFLDEICRDTIAGIRSKYPSAIIPSDDSLRERIISTLNIEGLAPTPQGKAEDPE